MEGERFAYSLAEGARTGAWCFGPSVNLWSRRCDHLEVEGRRLWRTGQRLELGSAPQEASQGPEVTPGPH